MRKVFLWVAALTVGGLMLDGAFACDLNRQASQPNWATVLAGACSGSNCLVDPPQDPLTSDLVQDCGAAYFDPGTYSGNDGLFEWLMASLVTNISPVQASLRRHWIGSWRRSVPKINISPVRALLRHRWMQTRSTVNCARRKSPT